MYDQVNSWTCAFGENCQDVYDVGLAAGSVVDFTAGETTGGSVLQIALYAPGVALGLAYSSADSLRKAVEDRRGVYQSRSRGLWVKGETSGSIQQLLRVDLDCDRDALRFVVRQEGSGFCHRGSWSCWGPGLGLGALERRLRARLAEAPDGSFTARLAREPELLAAKLAEEARELAEAADREAVVWEAADLVYFTAAAVARGGVSLAEVMAELDRRGLTTRRRDGSRTFGATGEGS